VLNSDPILYSLVAKAVRFTVLMKGKKESKFYNQIYIDNKDKKRVKMMELKKIYIYFKHQLLWLFVGLHLSCGHRLQRNLTWICLESVWN
jgi:hypothetical protein